MTSNPDFATKLVDLTGMSLHDLRSTQAPALRDAVSQSIDTAAAALDGDVQDQSTDK